MSINRRRYGVVITLLSLLSTAIIFEYWKNGHLNAILKISEFISLIVLVISITITYINTGLWKFTHTSLEKLDEREVALTSKSLRYAYSIFTIIVLILLLSFSIVEKPINIVLVTSLILLAHLLPASVIIWLVKPSQNE